MAIEIGIRISADNMTGRDFDRLVGDLERTETTTEQVSRSAESFVGQLGGVRTELQNVALGAGAFTDVFELVGQNFVQAGLQLEGYQDGLIALEDSAAVADTGLASSTENIQLSGVSSEDVKQTVDWLRTVGVEAELANRSVTTLGDVLQTTYKSIQSDQLNTRLDEVTQFFPASEELDRVVPLRNFKLERIDVKSALTNAEDAFRNVADTTELERATQKRLSALDAVTQISREEIEVQLEIEGAALVRLYNQEHAESEHAQKISDLTAQLQQLEINYEQEKTRITREEVEKRTQFQEKAAQLRIDFAKREAAAHLKHHQEVFGEIARTLRDIDDTNLRNRTHNIFGGLLVQSVAPLETLDRSQDFITLTDGMQNSLQTLETATRAFGVVFKREFTEAVQSGARIIGEFSNRLSAPYLATLAEEVRGIEAITRLETGQAARDQRTADIFAAGASAFQKSENQFIGQGRAYVSRYRAEQTFLHDRLVEGTAELIAAIPLDVVDAVKETVQVRSEGTAEILRIEQEAAVEIQLIQESVTLSAENKAAAIERIERQSALKRIQIENEVSARQRASFQLVATDFLSGIAQMIAAEAQLALARRATSAISGLFGGGGAAAAGGAGLLSGVLLPLLGGLGLAYGTSQLISLSSPSAEVYQRSRYASIVSPEDRTNRNVSHNPGTTRASQESVTPVLETNVNVTVEASGTRLGQANARVAKKLERWGG